MKRHELPKIPLKFLRWYCKQSLIDEIEGDLIEVYYERCQSKPTSAKWKFYKEVLQSFNKRNIGIMEKYKDSNIISSRAMLLQYGRVLFRTIQRSKIYTSISIVSLVLGITCAGLIYLYLNKERSYDQVYTNGDNVYRINHLSKRSGRSYAFAPLGMVPHLIDNMPSVKDGTRIFKYRRAIPITVAGTRRSFNEPRFGWADPSFFKVFNLNLIQGDPNHVLERPNVVALITTTLG
ncbi:MAG: hypothetical protein AAFN93_00370, partial [Bacteroidota bacterium]